MSRERSRHRRSHGLRTLLALSLLSLAACNVGPDFQKPQATQVQAWSAPARPLPARRWTVPCRSAGGRCSTTRNCRP
ncbi:hypothetical protein PBOI14_01850 [Pseudomonas sp. Boi14]|nr:hypothetical protein PBOI14_01850 [Pseudomonas sp. Boi14]